MNNTNHEIEILNVFWSNLFKDLPPDAPLLRHICPKMWIRFYTLPKGKRYPNTSREMQEILNRHNTLLDFLITRPSKLLKVTSEYSTESDPGLSQVANTYYWRTTLIGDKDDEEAQYCHWWVEPILWMSHCLDALLERVAEDKVENVLLISLEKILIYHPYDGGADIFAREPSTLNSMSATFSDWLPD